MIGTRTFLAFTLLCLFYFVAQLSFEKYPSFPTVKVELTGGSRLPTIKWGGGSGTNDYPDDTTIDSKYAEASLSLHKWLMKRGLMPGKAVPIVTIADSSYLRILHATQHRLRKWGYDHHLVVLCLDEACTKDSEILNPYPGYLLGNDAAMHAVAFFKFMANLDLAENGFDFVFLDADVFFTGSHDPFSVMLPLSNKTWDLQFQTDGGDYNLALNIGWYFARSTPATRMFFRQSFAHWIQTKTDKWDQQVMNDVKNEIWAKEDSLAAENSAGSNKTSEPSTPPPLRIHMVEVERFRNFMFELWNPDFFGNQTATDEYISTAAAIHYTCIQHDLKAYFGQYYGGFGDIHGYYSKPPPLLRPVGISGTPDAVHKQVAFALALGKSANRTVAWPDTVDVFQRHGDGYFFQPRLPSVKAVSFPSANGAGYAVVEGQYLQNRAREGLDPLPEVHWSLRDHIGPADSSPSDWLDSLAKSLIAREGFSVITLDFTDMGAEWSLLNDLSVKDKPGYDELVQEAEAKFQMVFKDSGMEEFSASPLAEVAMCRWVNGADGCLANC